MKKQPADPKRNETAGKDTANAGDTEEDVPEVPQNGFGKFEYIN